jgi:hypothetical protein
LVIERNWDDEKDYMMKKVPLKHIEMQTEAGQLADNPILFMNNEDLKDLLHDKLNFYDQETLKTSLHRLCQFLYEPKDQELECNLIPSTFGSAKDLLEYASKSLINRS